MRFWWKLNNNVIIEMKEMGNGRFYEHVNGKYNSGDNHG
jgi:hypothetical protein